MIGAIWRLKQIRSGLSESPGTAIDAVELGDHCQVPARCAIRICACSLSISTLVKFGEGHRTLAIRILSTSGANFANRSGISTRIASCFRSKRAFIIWPMGVIHIIKPLQPTARIVLNEKHNKKIIYTNVLNDGASSSTANGWGK